MFLFVTKYCYLIFKQQAPMKAKTQVKKSWMKLCVLCKEISIPKKQIVHVQNTLFKIEKKNAFPQKNINIIEKYKYLIKLFLYEAFQNSFSCIKKQI